MSKSLFSGFTGDYRYITVQKYLFRAGFGRFKESTVSAVWNYIDTTTALDMNSEGLETIKVHQSTHEQNLNNTAFTKSNKIGFVRTLSSDTVLLVM